MKNIVVNYLAESDDLDDPDMIRDIVGPNAVQIKPDVLDALQGSRYATILRRDSDAGGDWVFVKMDVTGLEKWFSMDSILREFYR
jgi:hypothetical protein